MNWHRTIWAIVALWSSTAAARSGERIEFNRDIRPILSDNCFFCHGPDHNQRQADLRLDQRDEAVEAGAIVPGKPDASGLVARIFSADPKEVMPPPDSAKRLTAEQRELLRRWIAQGAEYQGHWAYVKPVKPSIPAGQSPIDYLIERRLEAAKLRFSKEAEPRVLIRRLYFDLLGLPPKPEEVEEFVSSIVSKPSPSATDPTAKPSAWNDAYLALVDRLLASPHYGERMALGWLDVVRFADTIGYHSDNPRNVWPYRDYVIRSFNSNKPFDHFTVEQLAGDLLPDATLEQRVASCFNRLLLTTEEGGAQAKDYDARMLGDRVRAVGTVWLGQTLGCCQCHDHKFDPATSRDFYSLGAFFADVREAAIGRREDGINVPDERQAAELARLVAIVAARQQEVDAPAVELATAQQAWESAVLVELEHASQWTPLHPEKVATDAGVKFTIEKDDSIVATNNPRGGKDTYKVTVKTALQDITALRLEVLADPKASGRGPGRAADGMFVLSEVSVTRGEKEPVKLAAARASYETPGFSAAAAIDGKVDQKGWSTLGALGSNQVLDLELAPQVAKPRPKSDAPDKPSEATNPADRAAAPAETTYLISLKQLAGSEQVLGRFRLLATDQPLPLRQPGVAVPPDALVAVLKTPPAERKAPDQKKLADYYRLVAPSMAAKRLALAEAKRQQAAYEATIPKCLVSVAQTPRQIRILPRGNFLDDSGEVVDPALPKYLSVSYQAAPPETGPGKRLTRLDLARWIVSRENPLTARVTMNRLWKQLFGIGLSKTLDDLGSQGEPPANPELLDWLACEFIDSGWDMKHMIRTIVSSRAYRQSSSASKELLARDPENRLIARQGRFRLDAELVRDNALSIAGLLVMKIGGPSVKPYQPDGYWENLNFPTRTYQADVGENQYRRGLYTWWQRSFLHPSLLAFDAPSREECAADRGRSNIPQQALVLLNDPSYVEAARVFAARAIDEGGTNIDDRIEWMWQQALQRQPSDKELAAVRSLVEKHQREFADDEPAAAALQRVGQAAAPQDAVAAELAAWTSAARVLLNLHETITRN